MSTVCPGPGVLGHLGQDKNEKGRNHHPEVFIGAKKGSIPLEHVELKKLG